MTLRPRQALLHRASRGSLPVLQRDRDLLLMLNLLCFIFLFFLISRICVIYLQVISALYFALPASLESITSVLLYKVAMDTFFKGVGKAPPGIQSNFDNPESLYTVVVVTVAICLTATTIFTLARLIAKRSISTWTTEDCIYLFVPFCFFSFELTCMPCRRPGHRLGRLPPECEVLSTCHTLPHAIP